MIIFIEEGVIYYMNIIKWIVIAVITVVILIGLQKQWENQFKYEGHSAEEWANEADEWYDNYDWLVACVQNNPHDAYNECL